MMSSDATDLVRLQAFQLGAMDFVPKPFTVLEIIIRARRAAKISQRDTERVLLRGTLAELGCRRSSRCSSRSARAASSR